MKLRSYQQELLSEMGDKLSAKNKAILAATTGAGKTEILIEFIKKQKGDRFLVLTHGQRTLRDNFADRLRLRKVRHKEITSGEEALSSNRDRVVVALPQNIHNLVDRMEEFDYLIVDEAHQYYGKEKKMYRNILKWHKGKQILVTATHYDLKGEKTYFSREQALNAGVLIDSTVDIVGVREKLADDQFTSTGELLETVDLTAASYKKVEALLTKTKRTLIVAHNTNFASKLCRRLKQKGVDVAVSDCYTDIDSENLRAFKAGEVRVLIVVMRGNIGFDYPNLQHIIDVSYTKNIQRIEQLLGRLSRKATLKSVTSKLYTKVIPDDMFPQYYIYMTGVMALGVDEIYRNWTGKQASLAIKIPGDGRGLTKAVIDRIHVGEFKVNKHYRTSFAQYVDVWKDEGEGLSTTVGAALSAISSGRDSDGNKRMLLEMAKAGEDKPSQKTKIGKVLVNYTAPSSDCYDEAFKEEIIKLRPDWGDTSYLKKQELLRMAKAGEDKPSQKTKIGGVLMSYTTPSSDCYDEAFKEEIIKLRPDWFPRLTKKGKKK